MCAVLAALSALLTACAVGNVEVTGQLPSSPTAAASTTPVPHASPEVTNRPYVALESPFVPDPERPRLMILSGDVTADGRFEPRDVLTLLGPYRPEPPNEAAEASRAEVIGTDADGVELFRLSSSIGVLYSDYIEQEPWRAGIEGSLRAHLPRLPDLQRLSVELDGVEVWSEEATAAAPTADVAVDGTNVSWQVADDDGPRVSVTVYFFGDGDEVETIDRSTARSGEVDLNDARLNAAENGHVVVFVTDGLNAATATAGPVGVTQSPPELYLDWPTEGISWNSTTWLGLDVIVTVAGRACVGNCDTPEGHEVVWFSDLDGEFGRGAALEIFPEADGHLPLTIGEHQITVVVTDGHGNRSETKGRLTIVD